MWIVANGVVGQSLNMPVLPVVCPYLEASVSFSSENSFREALRAGKDFLQELFAPPSQKIHKLELKADEECRRGNRKKASNHLQKAGLLLWIAGNYHRAEEDWIRSAQLALNSPTKQTDSLDASINFLVSQEILMPNLNRGIVPGDDYLVTYPIGFGTVATVKKVFGKDIVFKVSGRSLRGVDVDRPGAIADALKVSRERFREEARRLQKLGEEGLGAAAILYASEDLIV